MKTVAPSLLAIPRSWDQGDPDRLPPSHKVFALRDLPFAEVKAVGFDMDYTLARYRSPEIDALAFTKALRFLVREKDYPVFLLESHYDPAFAVRGLILDGEHGNLLKLAADRQVVRATHGRRMLEPAEIEAVYGRRRLTVSVPGFRSIDTLFEISECGLYAQLVDALDAGKLPGKTYMGLFHDVRWAIDTAHRQGDMKAEILSHRDFFIPKDPQLGPALERLRRGGKKVFLLTNSEWAFTDGVLSHMMDGQDEAHPRWTDHFDLIVVQSRKPLFYTEGTEPKPVPGCDHAFTGGHAAWLEDKLQAGGEEILYVGDHIYGDVLRSKKTASWRTMLLVPELERELELLEQKGPELREIIRLEAQRRRALRKASMLSDQVEGKRHRRHALAAKASPEALTALDREMAATAAEAEAQMGRARACAAEVAKLNHVVEAAFSPLWGPIFRDGYEQTRFADQIHQYACAYTGRVSNFSFVDPRSTLYAPLPTLPHERV